MTDFSALMRRLLKLLLRNLPLRLLSLFLALCLWAGLITQDDSLTRERSFSDVAIAVNGADTLRRNSGLVVVSGLEAEALNVRMRANVPQSQYNNVSAATYNPRIDLSRITEAGEQTVKVQTSSTSLYGSVTYLMPDTVTVQVEEYVTNYRVPMVLRSSRPLPEGWFGATPTTDPSTVTVSGPKSVVDRIACVCVDYSLNGPVTHSGRFRTSRPFTFEDEEGNTVESDQVEVSSENILLRSIIVNQMVYACKTLPVSAEGIYSGKPADGYEVDEVLISPAEVSVAADDEALSVLEAVFADSPLNINNAEENVTGTLRLKRTSDIVNYSVDTVTVTVKLKPVITSNFYSNLRVQVIGADGNLNATVSPKNVKLMMHGPQNRLQSIRTGNITAYVLADGLEEGEHQLKVHFAIEDTDTSDITFLSNPTTVQLKLTAK